MGVGSRTKMVGIMSGSSLDGLDLCKVTFTEANDKWTFDIEKVQTVDIPREMKERLRSAPDLDQEALDQLDQDYGLWIGHQTKAFLNGASVAGVALHGHTVFHEPKQGISLQIGHGAAVANVCGVQVIDTFRIEDIHKGGQGAPLVPVGERFLFSDYQFLVNLGGIANMTRQNDEGSRAWDMAPCNQVLNHFARMLDQDYDEGGSLARTGKLKTDWLAHLRSLAYFRLPPPKSLSNQWGVENILKQATTGKPEDMLHTYTVFLSEVIANSLLEHADRKAGVLFTGGGAFNHYLIALIEQKIAGKLSLEVPESTIVGFKEALIFAFLGLLRLQGKANVYASVTGAGEDTCAGKVHRPGT